MRARNDNAKLIEKIGWRKPVLMRRICNTVAMEFLFTEWPVNRSCHIKDMNANADNLLV
jgi:hypothetical protein